MSFLMVKLGAVATLARQTVQPEDIKSGTLYVGLENIEKGGKLVNVSGVELGDLASNKFRFCEGHVLYGKLRPYLAKIALPNFEGICSTDIIPIQPGPELDARFLAHYLRTPALVALASDRATGANLPRLSPSALLDLEIPLPPIEEQRRIATILDKAEELRAKRQAALNLLDQLPQAIFLEMFGDPASNPMSWSAYELSTVVQEGTIVTYGIVQAGEEHPSGVPYIRTGDIVDGEIKLAGLRHTDPAIASRFQRSRVEAGEIVMSIRATVGTVALVPGCLDGANLTQGTARISPGNSTDKLYLFHYLSSPATQHLLSLQVKGATFREITLARLRQLPILVPPIILQRQFAARIEGINRARVAHQAALAQLDALFASLQDEVFSARRTAPKELSHV